VNREDAFRYFAVVWGLIGAASLLYLGVSRNAAQKRAMFPWIMGGSGLLFALLAVWHMGDTSAAVLVVPGVLLITWLNIRNTHFCVSCGRTVYHYWPFSRMSYCSRCGAPIR
jgi:hypothetical protein